MVGWLSPLGIERERVETLREPRSLQLSVYVCFAENVDVVLRYARRAGAPAKRTHKPISGNELRRMSMRSEAC